MKETARRVHEDHPSRDEPRVAKLVLRDPSLAAQSAQICPTSDRARPHVIAAVPFTASSALPAWLTQTTSSKCPG